MPKCRMAKGKLVRDRIPEIIREHGTDPEVRVIAGDELFQALVNKVIEESEELRTATRAEALEELADIFEVVRALAAHLEIEMATLEATAASKAGNRGGFTQGLWLSTPTGHILSDAECDRLLRTFRFGRDDRKPPDERRRSVFKQGWNRGDMSDATLSKRLTWMNLGHRAAESLSGRAVDPDDVFDSFAAHYRKHGPLHR